MSFRKLIRNTFGFSRAQTNGFVVLLPLLAIALFSEPIYSWWVSQRTDDFTKEKARLDSLYLSWQNQKKEEDLIQEEDDFPVQLFSFDPNETVKEEFMSLGFSKGLTSRIINYREKGGKFRIKSDLRKIYGMDSAFYVSIAPYILLPDELPKETFIKDITRKKKELFNLNEADTTELIRIYGIGSKLAARIVEYRVRLGGFVKQDQVNEVFGLDSTVVSRIIQASFIEPNYEPNKININTVQESALLNHPYFSRKVAKAIISYRFQHGDFKSVEELKNIHLVDEPLYNKILPYLTTKE